MRGGEYVFSEFFVNHEVYQESDSGIYSDYFCINEKMYWLEMMDGYIHERIL